MKIIDETKVKNEISKIEKVVNGKLSTAFENGVEFAENELRDLAIEFYEYIFETYHIDGGGLLFNYVGEDQDIKYEPISVAFKEFIEQRTK